MQYRIISRKEATPGQQAEGKRYCDGAESLAGAVTPRLA